MSSTDSLFRATESFQRLEDFSNYTSCIKCYGKPIIPPLLTIEQREEIFRIRSAAVKIEANYVKRKQLSNLPSNLKATYNRDKEHLPACKNNNFDSYGEEASQHESALLTSYGETFNTFPVIDNTLVSNEMHMSTSKIPSGDICSTVHKNVIVFSNVVYTSNTERDASRIEEKFPMSNTNQNDIQPVLDLPEYSSEKLPMSNADQNDIQPVLGIPEYYLYQDEGDPDLLPSTEMPDENTHTVRAHSVSEDEHDSITESTEFESLPTVINARKFVSQDTDNESSVTCLSQSTDLEKYMDSSIEYSSPDDANTLAQSHMSSQLNMSTRSDDASSETLVNTESELTPCASAMALLNCADDARSVDGNTPNTKIPYVPQRAHSVDSYVKMLKKACATKLPIRKSQSEPYNSNSKQHSIAKINSHGSNLPNTAMVDQDLKTTNKVGDNQNENNPVSDSEICFTFKSKTEGKKSLKRKHVRTNSYTLDHPSPALIMAHADCNCNTDIADFPPHSCSLDNESVSPPNLAFKKEKVNIVLPPTSERDKFFPFLNTLCLSPNKTASDAIEESKISASDNFTAAETLLPEAVLSSPHEKEIATDPDSASCSIKQAKNSEENSCTESAEHNKEVVIALERKSQDFIYKNDQIDVSSVEPCELKNNDIKELLQGVIRDVKEIQKNRINQFLEEQNKLWFKMKEEFKEQEKLLCEKLKIVNISSLSDGTHPMSYQFSDIDINNCSIIENNLHTLSSNNISYSNANSDVEEDCVSLQTSNSEASGVKVSQQLSNQPNVLSYPSSSVSDITSSNFKTTELSQNNIDSSQSATSFQSSATTGKESRSSSQQLGQPTLLSTTSNDSLPNRSINDQVRSISCQSNLSAEPNIDSVRLFKNKFDLNDRSDSISMRSDSSVDGHFKGSEVPTDNSQNSSGSGILTQSMYRNVLRLANGSETNFSSMSYRSSSDLSTYSDMTKLYNDSQFLNLNNFPECILSPTSNCDDIADHKESRSVCPDCQSSLQYCSKPLFQNNLHGEGNRHYPTSISPIEFTTHPSIPQNNESTFTSLNSLLLPNPELATAKLSFKYGNKDLDCKVSEITSGETDQYSFLNNNLRSNVHSCQNALVMNTKNNLDEINGIEDEHYREREIRAINDLVQSSYTRSYSCQSNEDYCGASIATNEVTKNQSHLENSQSLYQISPNGLSNDEKGASKKISTTSLTNLKRRQSRDIIKDPVLLKRFEKLPALVKGYLTRRLFKTERVQDLIKTLKDTAVLIGNLSQELNLKGNSRSENDMDLYRQLIVQLMSSFESLYAIFCTLSIKEKMEIISESRNFRMKKKAMEKKDSTAPAVAEKYSSSPNKKPKLSAATLKALERKRTSINSRTYTLEDFKGCKQRMQSSASSSKSHSVSPTRIYKSSIGTSIKRKTTSVRKASPWK